MTGCNAATPAEEWADCSEQLLLWACALVGGQPWVPMTPHRASFATPSAASGGSLDAASDLTATAWDKLVQADRQVAGYQQAAGQDADSRRLADAQTSAAVWRVTHDPAYRPCLASMHVCTHVLTYTLFVDRDLRRPLGHYATCVCGQVGPP